MRQIRLFEQEQSKFEHIHLGDLPSDEQLPGPYPTPALIRQIEANGMETAVNIVRRENGELLVIGGARRIKALRQAGYDDDFLVPCMVRPWRGAEDLIEAIGLNTTAQRNRAVEVRNLVELAGMMTPADVAHETGASLHDVAAAIAIAQLPPGIYLGFLSGAIAYGTARLAATCSGREQAELALMLETNGKLRRQDVADIRRSTAQAVDVEQLDLFERDEGVRWSVTQVGNVLRLRGSDGRVGIVDVDGVEWKESDD